MHISNCRYSKSLTFLRTVTHGGRIQCNLEYRYIISRIWSVGHCLGNDVQHRHPFSYSCLHWSNFSNLQLFLRNTNYQKKNYKRSKLWKRVRIFVVRKGSEGYGVRNPTWFQSFKWFPLSHFWLISYFKVLTNFRFLFLDCKISWHLGIQSTSRLLGISSCKWFW